MISILKKVEKQNSESEYEELKATAIAYWQTYLRRAK